jgi:hypothetical protein
MGVALAARLWIHCHICRSTKSSGIAAQFADTQPSDLIRQRLARPADVAVDLADVGGVAREAAEARPFDMLIGARAEPARGSRRRSGGGLLL